MIPIIKLIFYEILNWSLENLFVGPDEYIQREYQQVQKQVNIYINQLKLDLEKLGGLQYQLPVRDA